MTDLATRMREAKIVRKPVVKPVGRGVQCKHILHALARSQLQPMFWHTSKYGAYCFVHIRLQAEYDILHFFGNARGLKVPALTSCINCGAYHRKVAEVNRFFIPNCVSCPDLAGAPDYITRRSLDRLSNDLNYFICFLNAEEYEYYHNLVEELWLSRHPLPLTGGETT